MKERYVSVSGAGTIEDRIMIGEKARDAGLDEVIIGVQATTKTQAVGLTSSRGQAWHPRGDTIWQAFESYDQDTDAKQDALLRTTGVIHYSCAQPEPEALEFQVLQMLRRMPKHIAASPSHLQGIQLNNLNLLQKDYSVVLEKIVRALGDIAAGRFIILQIPSSVMRKVADLAPFARRIGDLPVTHTLLDTSGGVGKSFNFAQYKEWLEVLWQEAPHIYLSVAGGLGPDSMDDYRVLFGEFNGLSCDAEARLRTNVLPLDETRLDPESVGKYLLNYAAITQ